MVKEDEDEMEGTSVVRVAIENVTVDDDDNPE